MAAPAFGDVQIDRVPLGVVFMVLFCLSAPLIDVAAKMASQQVTVTQVTLARYGFQVLLMLPLMSLAGSIWNFSRGVFRLLLLRALFGLVSTYSFVAAVQSMPIADALAIVFVEPFILLALGFLLFGEQVGPRRIIASLIGFAGALLVIQPNFAIFGLVALWPLVTAVAFAFYILVTRRLSRDLPPVALNFHTAWIAVLLMLPALGIGQLRELPLLALSWPEPVVWLQLFFVALAATVSHIFISYALRFAPSATIAPLHYLEIVSAAALGWLFFRDWPNLISWTGIVIIAASGLFIIWREHQIARG
ncbi:DMT family transporter [Natronohydrobacter thiooxidans]|jgi:drug/metabolite transporter (DMT)-like permease|uniref:DMT family transporter n=1 Tax=Natronohydrobacter thiooxidans TaxID=87172 RepID=UPI0008FF5D7D|nr:DMT family transporter [Natronohydrobacter thiooxidans]